jgi:ribosomal-protein-alanine N-acetyltransferase
MIEPLENGAKWKEIKMNEYKHMVMLETPRLYVIPLTYLQLLKYGKSDGALEAELGLTRSEKFMTAELRQTIEKNIIPSIIHNPSLILYSTLWIIIHKDQNVIVGDAGFKGPPNEEGMIEIGYGTYPSYENKGYMTEALAAIIKWTFAQSGIQMILAHTLKDDLAWHQVLLKNCFSAFQETENTLWWKLKII